MVYLVSAVRTAIGKFGGSLASVKAKELGSTAALAAIQKAALTPEQIDETVFGCARQAGIGPNIARQISRQVNVPASQSAHTINMACGSGLKAVLLAAQSIQMGEHRVVLAGGVESMSNIPYLLNQARWGYRMGHGEILDANHVDGYFCPMANKLMGATAEDLAVKYAISRDEQDAFALESQKKAKTAIESGRFTDEITSVEVASKKGMTTVATDEHPRFEASLADLAKLKPVFSKDGTITAGNSSGVTDGASALVLASEDAVMELGLQPMARIVGFASAGVDPREMGLAPVPAVRKLLQTTGVTLDTIDLVELNEAFAAQVIACDRELHLDRGKLNVNGGAIALGHPTGCTGARITTTLVHEMIKRKSRLGLATLCISGGLGLALLIERV